MKKIIPLLFISFFVSSAVFAQEDLVPVLQEPVTDLTNTLSFQEWKSLRDDIMRFEDSTSNQIAVLIMPTLNNREIREFGISVLEKNAIGQKGKDNGILLLVVKEDRKVSIEVGYGLEGVLTDATSSDIIQSIIIPSFRDGDYYTGIRGGVLAIEQVTKGEYKASGKKSGGSSWIGLLLVLGVVGFAILASMRNRRYNITSRGYRNYGPWWWGGIGGGGSRGNWSSFGGGGSGGSWSAGGGSFGGGGASGSW